MAEAKATDFTIDEADLQVDSSWSSPIIRIVVGPHAQVFFIHRDILIEKSPFFRACLSFGMIEQQNNQVTLPEDTARAFELLAKCMYNSDIKLVYQRDIMSAMQAWQLADKLCMPGAQNKLVDKLKEYWKWIMIGPQFFSWVVKNTSDTSQLRKFVFDQLSHELVNHGDNYLSPTAEEEEEFDENKLYWRRSRAKGLEVLFSDSETAFKLFWAVRSLEKGKLSPAMLEGCQYHVHKEGESCSEKTP